jgi:hypothetical protein
MRRICEKNKNYYTHYGRSTDHRFTKYPTPHEYEYARHNPLYDCFYYRPHLLAYPFAGNELASAGSGFTLPRLATLSNALRDEVNRETAEPVPAFMMRAGHGCQAGAPAGLSKRGGEEVPRRKART